ncbi:MAG TPA: hypothetical protein VF624_07290 [Tepidisphaeraceae bacterium]|jgi:hypothetical protein
MSIRMRNGKGFELTVLGLLTLAGFDAYAPLVDDQGIDGVLRVKADGQTRYFDLQIKGSKGWNGIRCKVSSLPPNGVLILYCDDHKETLWFLQDECLKLFPALDPTWGDIFLKVAQVKQFREEGRNDLTRLMDRLRQPSAQAAVVP